MRTGILAIGLGCVIAMTSSAPAQMVFKQDPGGATPTLRILGKVDLIPPYPGVIGRLSARDFVGLGPGLIEPAEAGAQLKILTNHFLIEGSFTITCTVANGGDFFVDDRIGANRVDGGEQEAHNGVLDFGPQQAR